MWISEQAAKYGLGCYQEGVVPVRDEKGHWDEKGDISCAYAVYVKAGDCEDAIRIVIADLQATLARLVEMRTI